VIVDGVMVGVLPGKQALPKGLIRQSFQKDEVNSLSSTAQVQVLKSKPKNSPVAQTSWWSLVWEYLFGY
jgi:hypothetical protein